MQQPHLGMSASAARGNPPDHSIFSDPSGLFLGNFVQIVLSILLLINFKLAMHLFIDTISTPATYILFDSERNIVAQEFVELKGRESEHFLVSVLEFLAKNRLEYPNLEGAIMVNGPGSFTAMRIITLVINTLSFVHHIPLYGIDYFALGGLSSWDYPILLRANRGEYLIQRSKDAVPEFIQIPDIPSGSYFWMGDTNDFTNGTISIQSVIRYDSVCKNLQMEKSVERIEPLYIKKPNIT